MLPLAACSSNQPAVSDAGTSSTAGADVTGAGTTAADAVADGDTPAPADTTGGTSALDSPDTTASTSPASSTTTGNTDTSTQGTGNAQAPQADGGSQGLTFQVNAGMPLYKCDVTVSGDGFGQATKIVITDAGSGAVIQTIAPPTPNESATKAAAYFVDVTFDGNLDILIPYERPASYIRFDAFVWDASSRQFIETPSFQDILNPAIDPVGKRILSTVSNSSVPVSYTLYSMYSFQDSGFALTNRFEMDTVSDTENPDTNAIDSIHCLETKGPSGNEAVVNSFIVPGVGSSVDQIDPGLAPYFADGSFWDLNNAKWQCSFLNDLK